MQYLDFELEIGPGLGREYPVAVLRSPAGEARATMRFPYDELALQNRLQALQIALLRSGGSRRRVPLPEEQTVQDFGQDLFNALVVGEIRSLFDISRREASQKGKGLRLKLRIQSPELAALPWEFLYDHRQGEYLCLSKNTPTIRYLELPQPIPRLTVAPPLRLLAMMASPSDLPPLDVTRERQRIETAVQDLHRKGILELTWMDGQTWRDVMKTMRRGPWHIFHFTGHGGFDRQMDEGLIALADEQGRKHLLPATDLALLLADHHSLRLVLLNTCEGARGSKDDIYSSTAAILVRRGLAAVLAMQYEISDRAAIEFSRVFYEALADGLPVDTAATEARIAVNIAVDNSFEWGTPVLYMRSPDGVLFELTAPPPDQPAPVRFESTREPTPPEPAPPEVRTGRLWVHSEPEGASIYFLNIRADFSQGMELEPGSYHVEVSATGCAPKREWIELGAREDRHLSIPLIKIKAPPKKPRKPHKKTEAPSEKEITNTIGMKFVLIPAGTFLMGSGLSPEEVAQRYGGEVEWFKDERQQHQVTLSRPLYLQTTPVTQGQWQQVMGNNPAYFEKCGDACPVEQVSWDDTQEFLKKLNEMEQTDTYRLPTEAEWEYACRAGSTGEFYFGDKVEELENYAWYDKNSQEKTHPVGKLKSNAWGLYDMHGHVWEWCQDWYGLYAAEPVVDPKGPDSGPYRVMRGGSYLYDYGFLRSAYRTYGNPGSLDEDPHGFRVARTF